MLYLTYLFYLYLTALLGSLALGLALAGRGKRKVSVVVFVVIPFGAMTSIPLRRKAAAHE